MSEGTVRCYICKRVRPDPPTGKEDSFDWRKWEHDGEGWHVFGDWTGAHKDYLCRGCARVIKYEMDRRRIGR